MSNPSKVLIAVAAAVLSCVSSRIEFPACDRTLINRVGQADGVPEDRRAATVVQCNVERSSPGAPPDCSTVAKAYIRQAQVSQSFIVMVYELLDARQCSGFYSPHGVRLDDVDFATFSLLPEKLRRETIRLNQGRLLSYDPAASTLTLDGDDGKTHVFRVTKDAPSEGRTMVKLHGLPSELGDVPIGARLAVYGLPASGGGMPILGRIDVLYVSDSD